MKNYSIKTSIPYQNIKKNLNNENKRKKKLEHYRTFQAK